MFVKVKNPMCIEYVEYNNLVMKNGEAIKVDDPSVIFVLSEEEMTACCRESAKSKSAMQNGFLDLPARIRGVENPPDLSVSQKLRGLIPRITLRR